MVTYGVGAAMSLSRIGYGYKPFSEYCRSPRKSEYFLGLSLSLLYYLHYSANMQVITIQSETIFQSVADATRLRIIRLMAATGEECCLCELVDSLLEPSYKLSRHLKILRQAGLLSSQKEGRWVYHRLVMEPPYLELLYATVKALPDSDGTYSADLKRFRDRLCLREDGRCQIGIQSQAFKAEVE